MKKNLKNPVADTLPRFYSLIYHKGFTNVLFTLNVTQAFMVHVQRQFGFMTIIKTLDSVRRLSRNSKMLNGNMYNLSNRIPNKSDNE